jgi:hypothetical protein
MPRLQTVLAAMLLAILVGGRQATAADRYFFQVDDSYAQYYIQLHDDGTYKAVFKDDTFTGLYDIIRGKRIVLHVQNQGDLLANYTPDVISLPHGSTVTYYRRHAFSAPREFTETWTGLGGYRRLYIQPDGRYFVYDKDSKTVAQGGCVVMPPTWDRALGEDNKVHRVRSTGITLQYFGHGAVVLMPAIGSTPATYKMTLTTPTDTVFFSKPYTKPKAAARHPAHPRPARKPRPVAKDRFGANGVGDDAGIDADAETQQITRGRR